MTTVKKQALLPRRWPLRWRQRGLGERRIAIPSPSKLLVDAALDKAQTWVRVVRAIGGLEGRMNLVVAVFELPCSKLQDALVTEREGLHSCSSHPIVFGESGPDLIAIRIKKYIEALYVIVSNRISPCLQESRTK